MRVVRRQWLLLPALLLAACQVPVKPVTPEAQAPAAAAATPAAQADAAETRPGKTPPATPPPAPKPEEPATPPDPIDTGAELFDHLAGNFQSPVCIKGDANRAWRKRYAGHPASFARHLEEILPLMAYVAAEVDRRGLPAEFVLIPIVESWYRPAVIGPGGPAGMWQMIASTARNHGIRIHAGYDGRLSPVASTDAALDYLAALSGRFDGDWRATAMAYNAGEYRILRAFRSNGHRDASAERKLPQGLSRITYDYVAKIRALACLIAEPGRQGLELPRDARFVPLARLPLPPGATSLDQAALKLVADARELRRLNPAYRGGRVPAGAPREVLVPAVPATLLAAQSLPPAPPPGDVPARSHRVRSGDTLSGIARKYGVGLRQLYRLNDLDGRSVLQVGQQLQVDP
ncbi:transglycosylase SLT domain-containing protein [Arenimonas sp.]|uniref:transglycosylase SLT domain-containing protein n=1 Tax=Arenimonas sp. TaxID=1872635 RepID=UPI0035B09734